MAPNDVSPSRDNPAFNHSEGDLTKTKRPNSSQSRDKVATETATATATANRTGKPNGAVLCNGVTSPSSAANDGVEEKKSCMKRCSDTINRGMEGAWYNIGYFIGGYPYWVIIGALVLSGSFIAGMVKFEQENDQTKLWIPAGSDIVWQQEWVTKSFPSRIRVQQLLMEANEGDNIVSASSVRHMWGMINVIKNISSLISPADRDFLFMGCKGLPYLFGKNDDAFENLTDAQVKDKVNSDASASNMLGGKEFDGNKIKSAKAATLTCTLTSTKERGDRSESGLDVWEENFVANFNTSKEKYDLAEIFVFNPYLRGKDFGETVSADLNMLFAGFILIILYVTIMLGEFNRKLHKIWLAVASVAGVGVAIGSCYGMSSLFGVKYGPVNSILPFLLLGIGIDDAFVIVQAWENLDEKIKESKDVRLQMAHTMRHAGVAITVTSITDFVVFAVSATSILSAMRSFCIFAAVGIFWVYIMQATFFAGFLCLDIRRAKSGVSGRDACCCCITLKEDYESFACSKKRILQTFFTDFFTPFILHKIAKPFMILLTLGLLGGGLYGILSLKQDFDPMKYLPSETSTFQFISAQDRLFPSDGVTAFVYTADINYFANQEKLVKLTRTLEDGGEIKNGTVENWFESLYNFHNSAFFENEADFCSNLTYFLNSPAGAPFKSSVKLGGGGGGGVTVPTGSESCIIKATRIGFLHRDYSGSKEQVKGMKMMKEVVDDTLQLPIADAFVLGDAYRNWETNEVIGEELLRNCLVSLACVLVVTLVLIAAPLMCIFIVICVLFTLVDVGGLFYFWGLNIETVTATCLTIAIGLCIDYAAHIGSMFMTTQGSRNTRAAETIRQMAPAVFNGGFSTFLAFILLAGSKSFIFQTFFKVFFSVVLFGLFHGLVFLPVILSYIGPAAHAPALESDFAAKQKDAKDEENPPPANKNVDKIIAINDNNFVHLIHYENRVDAEFVEYKSPKDFVTRSEFSVNPAVTRSEFSAIPTVS